MATSRTFASMLNEYLTNRLMKEEMLKRDYFLQKVEKDDGWKGGTVPVPFKGAGASSLSWGSLTDAADIAEDNYVRGTISAYREVWGTIQFNSTDLKQHDGKIPETTFLRLMGETIPDFMQLMKEAASIQLLSGPNFATATDDTNAATGIFVVDKIDRFSLGQKADLDDNNSAQVAVYVIAIDTNTKEVTFSLTRGGAAANLSAYSVAQAAKFYHPGVWDGSTSIAFTSLKSALLSSANGGSANLHGISKLAYPYLQAVNVSGASITALNILDTLFDALVTFRSKAKGGDPRTFLMSYKHLGSILKVLEVTKGAFKVVKETIGETTQYGWSEIMIADLATGKAPITVVGIQEMPDDVIFGVDWSSMKFLSNGMFRKEKSPDGNEFYTVRATTGYKYLCDIALFGDLMVHKPAMNFVIYSIPNY